jgi:serine/threonine protein kinase
MDLDDAKREVAMLEAAQSPQQNVVQLADVMVTAPDCISPRLYIVMEMYEGNNLLSRVIQRQQAFPEDTVRRMATQLLQAVEYLHYTAGLIHCDLHPSNLLLDTSDHLYVADFGSAICISEHDVPECSRIMMTRTVYTAPELQVHDGFCLNITPAVDLWSVGVVLYFCLFGQAPKMQQLSPIQFPDGQVSRRAKQLISALLHADPTVRLTATEALRHSWLSEQEDRPSRRQSGNVPLKQVTFSTRTSSTTSRGRSGKTRRMKRWFGGRLSRLKCTPRSEQEGPAVLRQSTTETSYGPKPFKQQTSLLSQPTTNLVVTL